MRVLVACEESQEVCKAFRLKGHEAYSCDIIECSGGHPEWHIVGNALDAINSKGIRLDLQSGGCLFPGNGYWDMMIAHPPCTRLTNAGRRWMHNPPKGKTMVQMWSDFFDAVEFYNALKNAPIPKICIENPVMHDHAREAIKPGPRQVVQSWHFGDPAFKATGFELIGLPELVKTNVLDTPEKGTEEHKAWSWVHRLPPSKDRAKLRSVTFKGIAKAMADQWG